MKKGEEWSRYILKTVKVFTKLPEGWRINLGVTTAPMGYTWISNGKSRLSGQYEHALLKTA